MSTHETQFCDHCALPVGVGGVERVYDETERAFCCLGCSIAWRFAGGGKGEGGSEAAAFLLRIGLGVVMTMIVMLIQWVRYVTPEAAEEASYEAFAPWAMLVATTPVLLVLGVPYLWNALAQLRRLRIGADLLIGLGIFAGYAASVATMARGEADPLYFDTVAGLATLVTVGRWLEASAKERATAGLRTFLSDAGRPARRIETRNGEEIEVDVAADALEVGDRVRVLPGEAIPADGRVVWGKAHVDEAALTGEPLPRVVGEGDEVRSPTVPADGALVVRVERVGSETLLAQIGKVLSHARAERAPAERLADRIAAVFVPAVLVLAVVVCVLQLRGGANVADAVMRGLSILVVACPCALGIATPLATTAALGRLAARGVLVRSGSALSELPDVGTVVFDKTGTLTRGEPAVSRVVPTVDVDENDVLRYAASLERHSEHAWARGIVHAAQARELELFEAVETKVHPGLGIEGTITVNGRTRTVCVGSAGWLGAATVGLPVSVQLDGNLIGAIDLDDAPRDSAGPTVRALRDEGLDVRVLSGDAVDRARAVSARVGVDAEHVRGALLPTEKVEAVSELRAQSDRGVVFVGDGLNDAPALAAADLGIAVGSGTALAKESADVSLLGNDLQRIPALLEASRRTRRTVAWNLFWAFAYNGAAVTWAAWRGLPPVLAALAMVASSLFVIGNSVRLRMTLARILDAAEPG